MTTHLSAEQNLETPPLPQSGNPPATKLTKRTAAKNDEGDVWPTRLSPATAPQTVVNDLEFSGRIEKINIKETAAGERLTTFTMSAKNGGSRSYEVGAKEAELAGLVLAAFASKRKVRIATAPGDGAHPHIIEIEAWK
jgi:hypothetical protein